MTLPKCLDEYVIEENPVRVVDVFVDELDLDALRFEGVDPVAMGRPAHHPPTLTSNNTVGIYSQEKRPPRLWGSMNSACDHVKLPATRDSWDFSG